LTAIIELAETGKLPRRLASALIADGLYTVEDLARLTRRRLLLIPLVGPRRRQIIRALLAERGFSVSHLEEPPRTSRDNLLAHRRC
jgi:hypothetical protein